MKLEITKGRKATDIESILILTRDDKTYSIAQIAGFIEEAITARQSAPIPEVGEENIGEDILNQGFEMLRHYAKRIMAMWRQPDEEGIIDPKKLTTETLGGLIKLFKHQPHPKPVAEQSDMMKCESCGEMFNMANLHEVFFHEHEEGSEEKVADVIGIKGKPVAEQGEEPAINVGKAWQLFAVSKKVELPLWSFPRFEYAIEHSINRPHPKPVVSEPKGVPTEQEIEKAAEDDYRAQTKYDNAYNRKKGFIRGSKWAIALLTDNQKEG